MLSTCAGRTQGRCRSFAGWECEAYKDLDMRGEATFKVASDKSRSESWRRTLALFYLTSGFTSWR